MAQSRLLLRLRAAQPAGYIGLPTPPQEALLNFALEMMMTSANVQVPRRSEKRHDVIGDDSDTGIELHQRAG